MSWRDRFRGRDEDVDAEIDAHLRLAVQDRIDDGDSPAEARRRVLLDFGSVRAAREEARAVWRWTAVEHLLDDARSGARILTRSPGLSATAVVLIALVIGGNTSIYSVVHSMLTKPAPGVSAQGLVSIAWITERGTEGGDASYPAFEDVRRQSHTLDVAAFRTERLTLLLDSGAHAVRGASVTPAYFEILDLRCARGRLLSAADADLGPPGLTAVISHRLWQQRFGSAESVVGLEVALNGHPATVVGVAPPDFQGVWLAEATDVWVPLVALARLDGRTAALEDRRAIAVHGTIGRLRPGETLDGARAELAAISQRIQAAQPPDTPRTLAAVLAYTGNAGRDNLVAERGPLFLAIFSVVTTLTLVIVCANVANLMLARAVTRQREMAVRQSFGASRLRILRAVLAEGLALSLAAWAAACLFAYWMSRLLPRLIPPSEFGNVEVILDFTPDWQVIAYAMTLALGATIVFTIAPAIRTWRLDLLSLLKAGEQGVVAGRSRVAQALVVLQLAFSVLLLTAAGLGLRSLSLIDRTTLGFDTGSLLLFTVDTAGAARTADANAALVEQILGRMRAVPGLQSVSLTRHTTGRWPGAPARPSSSAAGVEAEGNAVGPDYFTTLGVPLRAGREFGDADPRGGPPRAVISRQLADALWPQADALGREFVYGAPERRLVVAGIAPDVLYGGFRRQGMPYFVFTSLGDERPEPGLTAIVARYSGSLDGILPAVRRALRDVHPGVPLLFPRTLDAELASSTWTVRALTVMVQVFAAAALLIAALGQYAAMSFSVRRRTRDFGIRVAMGASSRQIMGTALGEGLALTVAGLAIGLALGVVAGRSGQALLYGVTPADAPTHAGVVLVLGAASLAACYLPARRAARVNAVEALRDQ